MSDDSFYHSGVDIPVFENLVPTESTVDDLQLLAVEEFQERDSALEHISLMTHAMHNAIESLGKCNLILPVESAHVMVFYLTQAGLRFGSNISIVQQVQLSNNETTIINMPGQDLKDKSIWLGTHLSNSGQIKKAMNAMSLLTAQATDESNFVYKAWTVAQKIDCPIPVGSKITPNNGLIRRSYCGIEGGQRDAHIKLLERLSHVMLVRPLHSDKLQTGEYANYERYLSERCMIKNPTHDSRFLALKSIEKISDPIKRAHATMDLLRS